MSYAKYNKALNSLYGDTIHVPATIALPVQRSFAKSQKNSLPHVSRKSIEAGMQMKLSAWLHNADIPHLSIPNEGNRGQIATHRLKQMGMWPGASDLLITRRSRCGRWPAYWIELKTPGQKPRPNQLDFMERQRREGFKAEWFDSLADAQQSVIDYFSREVVTEGMPTDAK